MNINKQNKLASDLKLFQSDLGFHALLVDGSQIFDLDKDTYLELQSNRQLEAFNQDEANALLYNSGLYQSLSYSFIDKSIPSEIPDIASISLNVAQGCNMTCTYCYADEGKFGSHSRLMREEVALKAIDTLLNQSDCNDFLVGFMGGEPLLNKKLIHKIVPYAYEKFKENGKNVSFSLTTNATLLDVDDLQLFNKYPFSITISIDGDKSLNDSQRKLRNGKGSYDKVVGKLGLMSGDLRPKKISARVTVSPQNIRLKEVLIHLIELGFDEVGFSPVLVSPNPNSEFTEAHFASFLEQMIQCGEFAFGRIQKGLPGIFGNFETAMKELFRGGHKPYPCGAGQSYLSISAEGKLFACHRFIDNEGYQFGDLESGIENELRLSLQKKKHVDSIEPCNSCWARYLCGGGCYHEVDARGRIGCDYIRGWLSFCLDRYIKLLSENPNYFA